MKKKRVLEIGLMLFMGIILLFISGCSVGCEPLVLARTAKDGYSASYCALPGPGCLSCNCGINSCLYPNSCSYTRSKEDSVEIRGISINYSGGKGCVACGTQTKACYYGVANIDDGCGVFYGNHPGEETIFGCGGCETIDSEIHYNGLEEGKDRAKGR